MQKHLRDFWKPHCYHLIGLTGTLKALLDRVIQPEMLLEPGICFAFSCTKLHVINPDRNRVPMEATWSNQVRIGERDESSKIDKRKRVRPPKYQNDADEFQMVSYEAIDPRHVGLVEVFMAAVNLAERTGMTDWEIGNQQAFIQTLKPAAKVFWNGKKYTVADFIEEELQEA